MIRHIVAIDQARGMAKNGAMPSWKLKEDEAYFTAQTLSHGAIVLMGRRTFTEALHNHPLAGRTNYVLTRQPEPLQDATLVPDLAAFRRDWPEGRDLWIIGGSEIFAQTMDWADELYITEIAGDFGCDRFYPEYHEGFVLQSDSDPHVEHGVTFSFKVYVPARNTHGTE